MPFNPPIPESKLRRKAAGAGQDDQAGQGLFAGSGLIGAWVQAEKLIQIALMLPCAGFIGWLIGAGLDRWLHQTWIATAGIVLGIISGLVGAVQMAIFYANNPKLKDKNGDGTENGSSGDSE